MYIRVIVETVTHHLGSCTHPQQDDTETDENSSGDSRHECHILLRPTCHENIAWQTDTCPCLASGGQSYCARSQTRRKIVCREKPCFFLAELQQFRVQRTLCQRVTPLTESSYALGTTPCCLGVIDLPGFPDDAVVKLSRLLGGHILDTQNGMQNTVNQTDRRE